MSVSFPPQLGPVAPQTKTDAVAQALRQQIFEGHLPPGTALQQEDIARQLGVSVTPVREAFGILEAEGLVQRRAHRGVIVALSRDVDPWEQQLTLEVRLLLEGHALERIVASNDVGLVSDLEALLDQGDSIRRRDRNRWRQTISEFHRALARGLRSDLLIQTLLFLSSSAQFYPHAQSDKQLEKAHAFHRKLVAALRARDLPKAQAIWTSHAQDNDAVLRAAHATRSRDDGA